MAVDIPMPDAISGSSWTGTMTIRSLPRGDAEQAKAEELTALGFARVSRTTVQRMRLAYRKQGLWGLVDHRTTRGPSPSGRHRLRVRKPPGRLRSRPHALPGKSCAASGGVIPLDGRVSAEVMRRSPTPV